MDSELTTSAALSDRAVYTTEVFDHAVCEVSGPNRLDSAFRQVRQALTRYTTPEELLAAVCGHLVESAKIQVAWIVRLLPDGVGIESLVEFGGTEDWIKRRLQLNQLPGGESTGISRAIRTGCTVVESDFSSHADLSPIHRAAADAGFNSAAACRISVQGQPWGALIVYSADRDAFGEAEIHSVEAITEEISCALESFEAERARCLATEALIRSESQYRTLVDASPDVILETDTSGWVLFASDQARELLGCAVSDEVVGQNIFDWIRQSDLKTAREQFSKALTGQRATGSFTLERQRLPRFTAELVMRGVQLENEDACHGVIVIVRDVTERHRAEKQLNHARFEVILRLARAMEFRDDDTGGHLQRMGTYGRLVSERMGLDQETCEMYQWAITLHDIGKLGIPDAILLKPGKLTPEEYRIMQHHAVLGAEILSGSDHELIRLAERVARSHHEKWDGTGYPMRLAGEDIPLVSRICALCDVFDALTSNRPYKRAWSFDEAKNEVVRCSGSHFDPQVVKAFLSQIDGFRAVYESGRI